jgi:hypothetical protein
MTPQAQSILLHLQTHPHITPLEALGVYGVYRLAARIYEIKAAGFNILSKTVRDASGKPYARYSLAPTPFVPAVADTVRAIWPSPNPLAVNEPLARLAA